MCVSVSVCVCVLRAGGVRELLYVTLTPHSASTPWNHSGICPKAFFFPPEVPTETWSKTAELVLVPGEILQRSGGSTVAFNLWPLTSAVEQQVAATRPEHRGARSLLGRSNCSVYTADSWLGSGEQKSVHHLFLLSPPQHRQILTAL